MINSIECGVNLFIYLLLFQSCCCEILGVGYFLFLHILFMFGMFIFMGQITRSTFVAGG